MLTNAARGELHSRAPRSRSMLARTRASARRALAACAGCLATVVSSCGGAPVTESLSTTTYVAVLNGANERPSRSTSGTGTATFRVTGALATYDVAVINLAGAATVAHLIVGTEQTVVGQIVASLPVIATTGTIASGTIDLGAPVTYNNSTISGDSLRSLLDRGSVYVNVYSTTYPGGEVRGQIRRR
ncbi:MAG: domain containing protein [Gemmatimonadetes bacterium]|nr:domain containing protein [Gemmatimonadota bacterium]